jgi:hypothetical protein
MKWGTVPCLYGARWGRQMNTWGLQGKREKLKVKSEGNSAAKAATHPGSFGATPLFRGELKNH